MRLYGIALLLSSLVFAAPVAVKKQAKVAKKTKTTIVATDAKSAEVPIADKALQTPASALQKTDSVATSTGELGYKASGLSLGIDMETIANVYEVSSKEEGTATVNKTKAPDYNKLSTNFYPNAAIKLGNYKLKVTQPFTTYHYNEAGTKNEVTDPYATLTGPIAKLGDVNLNFLLRWYQPATQASKDMNRYGVGRAVISATTEVRKFSFALNNYFQAPLAWSEGGQGDAAGKYNYDYRLIHELGAGYTINDKWELGFNYAFDYRSGKYTASEQADPDAKFVEQQLHATSYVDPIALTYKPAAWASVVTYPEVVINHDDPVPALDWYLVLSLNI